MEITIQTTFPPRFDQPQTKSRENSLKRVSATRKYKLKSKPPKEHYLPEVPLSKILTIEKSEKQIPPNPINTLEGTKKALSTDASSKRNAPKKRANKAVITGINGIRFANLHS